MKKEDDYLKFIRSIKKALSENMITDISPFYLSEPRGLYKNKSSRGLLERVGFKYEGVGQSYLQINGRWRNHVLYGLLRNDRRGRVKES